MKKVSFVSLFSGCGGFDAGFIDAGFVPIAAFDNWPVAIKNYVANIDANAHCTDLGVSNISSIGTCDVVLAGSPCQGFSLIGKRKLHDPRNNLLLVGVQQAIRLRPRVIVIENVLGILSGEHQTYLESATDLLRENGYKTAIHQVNAATLGVAQNRRRVVIFAWKGNFSGRVELRTTARTVLRDALRGCDSLPNHDVVLLDRESDAYRISQRIGPGQKLCDVRAGNRSVHTWEIPEVFGETSPDERELLSLLVRLRRTHRQRDYGDADPVDIPTLERNLGRRATRNVRSLVAKDYLKLVGERVDLRHGFNGKYRRPIADDFSPTVDTRFGDHRYFLHPSQHRGFTVREAARIQGFADTFKFHGRLDDQYKLVGNAVPPPLARAIAHFVKGTMLAEFK